MPKSTRQEKTDRPLRLGVKERDKAFLNLVKEFCSEYPFQITYCLEKFNNLFELIDSLISAFNSLRCYLDINMIVIMTLYDISIKYFFLKKRTNILKA